MIYFLTPFCSNKRLGHIHNQYCALVPNDDDYICLMDPDLMFLLPHQQKWIEDIVKTHGDQWDLLGCMTNRIGLQRQQTLDYLFESTDIKRHIEFAGWMHKEYAGLIEESDIVAGFLMLFKKSLWNKIKFQEGIDFDIKFSNAVRAAGGKIGIMEGIYVWHSYRLGHDNPKSYKKHLLNK